MQNNDYYNYHMKIELGDLIFTGDKMAKCKEGKELINYKHKTELITKDFDEDVVLSSISIECKNFQTYVKIVEAINKILEEEVK